MLNKIDLPSGSDINIIVESDDYHFIQDEPVSKMYTIKGFSKTSSYVADDKEELYSNPLGVANPHNYLHVEVGDMGASSSLAKSNFVENYLMWDEEEIWPKLYLRSLVKVTPTVLTGLMYEEDKYEYVNCWAEVDLGKTFMDDVDSDGNYETAVIKLRDVHRGDKKKGEPGVGAANPLSKASWQLTRKYLREILYPIIGTYYKYDDKIDCGFEMDVEELTEDSDPEMPEAVKKEGVDFRDLFNYAMSQVKNVASLGGVNFMMSKFGYSRECVPGKTWVRLGMGSNSKRGGGHRVKSITVNDNWDEVKTTELESSYGTQYTYETFHKGGVVSSGVAYYEPIVAGADENTMREPLEYTIDVKMGVNHEEFQELPIGEELFANPKVVYSKVKVENKGYTNVTQNATGRTVYEYYTAKDFPIRFQATGSASASALKEEDNWVKLFSNGNYNYLTMSQGYSIEMNDMHGKFKSKKVYAENIGDAISNEPIYSMEHIYETGDMAGELNNEVQVVDEAGAITDAYIGRNIDMNVDLLKSRSQYNNWHFEAGIDVSYWGAVIVPLPSFWVTKSTNDQRFQSSATTKLITNNGILKKVELMDKGRYKSTENMLYDKKTGVPVVTRINHEQPNSDSDYEVPIYQYDYPAYWMYSGMGPASDNWGVNFTNGVTAEGSNYKISSTYATLVHPGDEIAVYKDGTGYEEKFWVVEKETSAGNYYLVDAEGEAPTYSLSGTITYRVIRSGKRNLLGSTAASVTSLDATLNVDDEFTDANSPYKPSFAGHTNVINASAVEYGERAYGYVSRKETTSSSDMCGLKAGQNANPYVQGLLANWNLIKSYVYDYTRNQTTGNSRIDGVFSAYEELWQNDALDGWEINTSTAATERWIEAAVATLFDREGFNLESQDALGIYSSILLGYNNTLKVGEAVNARFYEVGFDGFEDHDYDQDETVDCTAPHLRFEEISPDGNIFNDGLNWGERVSTEAHTGRHSMRSNYFNPYSLSWGAKIVNSIDHSTTNHGVPYVVQSQELMRQQTFVVNTTGTHKYVATVWAKVKNTDGTVADYDNAQVKVHVDGSELTNVVEHRSNIIDGWQRIEVQFEIPGADYSSSEGSLIIELEGDATASSEIYYDDFRVQPYNSEMVTYVIDPVSLRLWATLDSRNFATIYQYDEEGSLVRIIQETEKGKITVQENRAGIRIN